MAQEFLTSPDFQNVLLRLMRDPNKAQILGLIGQFSQGELAKQVQLAQLGFARQGLALGRKRFEFGKGQTTARQALAEQQFKLGERAQKFGIKQTEKSQAFDLERFEKAKRQLRTQEQLGNEAFRISRLGVPLGAAFGLGEALARDRRIKALESQAKSMGQLVGST